MQLPPCNTLQHSNIEGIKFLLLHVYLLVFQSEFGSYTLVNEKKYFFARTCEVGTHVWFYLGKECCIFATERKLRIHRKKNGFEKVFGTSMGVCVGLRAHWNLFLFCTLFTHLHSLWIFIFSWKNVAARRGIAALMHSGECWR